MLLDIQISTIIGIDPGIWRVSLKKKKSES